MSITTEEEFLGIQRAGQAVGLTLRKMQEYAQAGMSTRELDEYGAHLLMQTGAKSAPKLTYGFPGWTCVSLNHEIAHGIPSPDSFLQEGDLVNIDVSAEVDGYFADNGCSFVLGKDTQYLQPLVNASKDCLFTAINHIRGGVQIAHVGRIIELEAKKRGYRVIKNLVGHGIGRSLHEEPQEIPCYYDKSVTGRFKKNSVVAIETFISTKTSFAQEKGDGWTYITRDGSFVAQHEHTIMVTDTKAIILTQANQLWN